MEQDIRWEQRFSNYVKALHKLTQAVDYINHKFIDEDEPIDENDSDYVLDEMIREGSISDLNTLTSWPGRQ
jgi:uncharacterized protein YukE